MEAAAPARRWSRFLPTRLPGTRYLIVRADGGPTVGESNETNNTRTKSITVTARFIAQQASHFPCPLETFRCAPDRMSYTFKWLPGTNLVQIWLWEDDPKTLLKITDWVGELATGFP